MVNFYLKINNSLFAPQIPNNIVAVGNSMVRGYGGTTNFDWPNQLSKTGIASIVTNLGVDGRTTTDMLDPASTSSQTGSAPYFTETYVDSFFKVGYRNILIFFEIGNDNDASNPKGNHSISTCITNYRTYCNNRIASGWEVFVCTLPPRPSLTEGDRATANADIASNTNITMIDIAGDSRLGTVGVNTNEGGSAGHYFFDTTHPNSSGYGLWASLVARKIRSKYNLPNSLTYYGTQVLSLTTNNNSVTLSGSNSTNGGLTDSWLDLSGWRNHFTSSGSLRPTYNSTGGLNGHPSISSTGTQVMLTGSNVLESNFHKYFIMNLTGTGVIASFGNDYSGAHNVNYIYTVPSSGQGLYIDKSSVVSSYDITSLSWGTDGAWHTIDWGYEGTHASQVLNVDGTNKTLTNGTHGTSDPTSTTSVQNLISILGKGDGSVPVTGSICAVVCCLFKHNSTEQSEVRSMLTNLFA